MLFSRDGSVSGTFYGLPRKWLFNDGIMRKLAFGYSTRCNIRCGHCVAAGEAPAWGKMTLDRAEEIVLDMARAGVQGISFSAGEPFLYFEDICALVDLCRRLGIYTRIVTNGYWAADQASTDRHVQALKQNGLCQLRLSCSRWHQAHVDRENLLRAAKSCQKAELGCFVSLVTDFSPADDALEQFLRANELLFFPEPIIYAGRGAALARRSLATDYPPNCCDMNPYLAPDQEMYACCDAGSHFSRTGFFHLGSLKEHSVDHLLTRTETDRLHRLIRVLGLTAMASFAGIRSREIVTYGKCDLCARLFNVPETLSRLQNDIDRLEAWHR